MNDTELIAKLINRDSTALKEVINRYTNELLRYALSQTRSGLAAEELVDKVFDELRKAINNNSIDFEDTKGLKTYLFSKAKHRIIDYARHKKVVKGHRLTVLATKADSYDAYISIERRDLLNKLWKELQATYPDSIEILKLIVIEDLTQKQAAERLKMPLSTLHDRLNKVKDYIKEKYKGDYHSLLLALLLFSYSQN